MKKRNLIIACSALFTNTFFSSTQMTFASIDFHFTDITPQVEPLIQAIIDYEAFDKRGKFMLHGKLYAVNNIHNSLYNYNTKSTVTDFTTILKSDHPKSLKSSENGRLYLSLNSSAREMNGFLHITAILLANNEIPEGSILTAAERKNAEQKQEK